MYCQILIQVGQYAGVDDISNVFKIDYVRRKTRSLGQILKVLRMHCRGHILCQILLKISLNFCSVFQKQILDVDTPKIIVLTKESMQKSKT